MPLTCLLTVISTEMVKSNDMRLYVHCSGNSDSRPEYTKVFKLGSGNVTLQEVVDQFVAAYNAKFDDQARLQSAFAQLTLESGKRLNLSLIANKAVPNGADVFLQCTAVSGSQSHALEKHSPHGTPPTATVPGKRTSSESSSSSGAAAPGSILQPSHAVRTEPLVQNLMRQAAKAENMQHYRTALNLYQQVLRLQPKHGGCAMSIARIMLKAGRVDQAVHYAQQAVESDIGCVDCHQLLGDCLMAAGRTEAAFQAYQAGLGACIEVRPCQQRMQQQLPSKQVVALPNHQPMRTSAVLQFS